MDYVKAKIYYPKTSSGKPSMNGRWYVYWKQRGPDGELKLFKKKSGINTGSDVRERMFLAKELVKEIDAQIEGGWNFFGGENTKAVRKSVVEVMHELLTIKKDGIRHRTWRTYKYAIDSFEGFLAHIGQEGAEPSFINSYQAQQYCDYLMKVKKMKGKTFNGMKGDIVMFFNMMLARDLIAKNPFSGIKKQPEVAGTHVAYSAEEWDKIQDFLSHNNPRLCLFSQFIYYTFIRPAELLRLQVGNIDLSNGIIQIHGSQSKNRKSESVVIPDRFIEQVKAMGLERFPKDYYLFGRKLETGPVSMGRNSVTIYFRDALNKMGGFTSNHTLYSCKHTGVSAAYRIGVDIYAISRQCRHRTITETQNYMRSIGLTPNDEFRSKMK